MSRTHSAVSLLIALLSSLAVSSGGGGRLLLELTSYSPPGFYSAADASGNSASYAFSRFLLSGVIEASTPIVAPRQQLLARIERTMSGTYLVVRSSMNGDSVLVQSIPDGSGNLQWTSSGRIAIETPPVGETGRLLIYHPTTGTVMETYDVSRQLMSPSQPSLGACVLAPNGGKIAYIRVTGSSDSVTNLPTIACQDLQSGIPRYAIPLYSEAKVDGITERRVLITAGPATPHPMRHLSWSSNGQIIAFFGSVSYDRPYPTDPERFYRVGRQGLITVDIYSKEITVVRPTENFSLEHPDAFFFSPGGNTLAYQARPSGGRPHIYVASSTKPASSRDLGEGEFVVGQTTEMYWPLSPWSRSGGRLLIRRSDDAIVTRPSMCGSEHVSIEPGTSQLFIQSLQSADVDALSFVPSIQVVDPWPDLINPRGEVRTDAWLMLPRTHVVKGIAADGAARIVLRIVVPDFVTEDVKVSLLPEDCADGVSGNESVDGALSVPGSTIRNSSVVLRPQLEGTVRLCGAVYHAPEDFVSDLATDSVRSSRNIRLAVSVADITEFVEISVVRPPVVFIHGIWSSASVFNSFAPLQITHVSDPRFTTRRLDYSDQNTKEIDAIIGPNGAFLPVRMRMAITTALPEIAVVRGDIVGHSLGGVLPRYMAALALPTYFTPQNSWMGHVHKLISIDSPHLGSEYCDLLIGAANDDPVRIELLNRLIRTLMFPDGKPEDPVTGGIVDDLRPSSHVISGSKVPANLVFEPRLHTISGWLTKDQERANDAIVTALDLVAGLDLSENTFSAVFKGEPNDLVVATYSQNARDLFDNQPSRITERSGVAHSDGFLLTVPAISTKSGNASRVIELLNAPSNGPSFSSKPTPRQLTAQQPLQRDQAEIQVPTADDVGASRIHIKTSATPVEVSPGETFLLSIDVDPGPLPAHITLVGYGFMEADSTEPFEFTINVPISTHLGEHRILALGSDADQFDTLTYLVRSNQRCNNISFGTEQEIRLGHGTRAYRLSVLSMFEDGITREVSTDPATRYSVSDSSVADVRDGWLHASSSGRALVIASRCDTFDSIEVVVESDDLAPIADAGFDTVVTSPTTVVLDASASTDPERGSLTYLWWLQQRPERSNATLNSTTSVRSSFSTDDHGTYVVGLAVSDPAGNTDTTWRVVRQVISTTIRDDRTPHAAVHIFPNPASDHITLRNVAGNPFPSTIKVIDIMGYAAVVSLRSTGDPTTYTADLTGMITGIYRVALPGGDACTLEILK